MKEQDSNQHRRRKPGTELRLGSNNDDEKSHSYHSLSSDYTPGSERFPCIKSFNHYSLNIQMPPMTFLNDKDNALQ